MPTKHGHDYCNPESLIFQILLLIQLLIRIETRILCENHFTFSNDLRLVLNSGVLTEHSESVHQCTVACLVLQTCCIASYNAATMQCHLDTSGNCESQTDSSTGSVLMMKTMLRKFVLSEIS